MSRLIVIDGVDSSGKQTQAALTEKRLIACGKDVKRLSFPNYSKDYSIPVKMYLAGDLGEDAKGINPYGASALYAVDRFCSYKTDWQVDYQKGSILLCDRYTTSNAIHQGSKLEGRERMEYFSWLYDFEFDKMGLPRPDKVILLDMPPDISLSLMETRANKATGLAGKDIHERDRLYLQRCYEAAVDAAGFYGWARVGCTDGAGHLKNVEVINNEIFEIIKSMI